MNNLKKRAQHTPTAIGGLLLGVASFGNLVPQTRGVTTFVSLILLIIVMNKLIFDLQTLLKEVQSQTGGVVITIPVAFSVLSTYLIPYNYQVAKGLWIMALTLAILTVCLHTLFLISNRKLENINPSTFIMYVGVSVNAFVSVQFDLNLIGIVMFYFSLLVFTILLPLMFFRIKMVELPTPTYPMMAIFTSPASVLLNAYLILYQDKFSALFAYILFFFSISLWIYSILHVPKILKGGFYPSFASLTFPFIVSATAAKTFTSTLDLGFIFQTYTSLTLTLASLLLIFVLYSYIRFYIFS